MDEYAGKRVGSGLGDSRSRFSLSSKDLNHEGRSNQYCNQLECSHNSPRLNSIGGAEFGHSDRSTHSKESLCSITTEATSKPTPASSGFGNSHKERKNSTQKKRQNMNISHGQNDATDAESSRGASVQTVVPVTRSLESPNVQGLSENGTEALRSLTTEPSSKPFRRRNRRRRRRFGGTEDSSSSSLVQCSVGPGDIGQSPEDMPQNLGTQPATNGLRNTHSTPVPDVLQLGCSSSHSDANRNVETGRKRFYDAGSSSRGKVMSGLSSGSNSGSVHGLNPSLLGPTTSQPSSSPRDHPASEDRMIPVRTSQASSGGSRVRLPNPADSNSFSVVEPGTTSQLSRSQNFVPDAIPQISARSLPFALPHELFGHIRSSREAAHSRVIRHHEDSSMQIYHYHLGNRENYQHLNMEQVSEALSVLERIEQDNALLYEEFLALNRDLFAGSLNFHDQYRGMRLDIDDMSYEELLALEERMGTVSTAVEEEAFDRCLKKSTLTPSSISGAGFRDGDDVKCSICQEEYSIGDEVGKLTCEHCYHVACIRQWLKLKNWCPVCKTSVSAS